MDKIHGLLLGDRRVKVRVLIEMPSISTERVSHILREILGTTKLTARTIETVGFPR